MKIKIIDPLSFDVPRLSPEERKRMDERIREFKRLVAERDIPIVIPRAPKPRRPR